MAAVNLALINQNNDCQAIYLANLFRSFGSIFAEQLSIACPAFDDHIYGVGEIYGQALELAKGDQSIKCTLGGDLGDSIFA